MKIKLVLLLGMGMLPMLASMSGAAVGKVKFFGTLDYYLRGDADDQVQDDLDEAVANLQSLAIDASGSMDTKSGFGVHLGAMIPTSKEGLEVGGRVGSHYRAGSDRKIGR